MSRQRISVVMVAALLIGGAVLPPPSRAGDPEPANPGAATDKRNEEVRLTAELLVVPPLEFRLPEGHDISGGLGRNRYGMGLMVLVAVDGTGRVVDAAGGPLNWYERRGRRWVIGTGPYSIEDLFEIERAAVAGALQSRFSLPPGTRRSPSDIYRGRFEIRWEISEGKPLTDGLIVMTRGPAHDFGLVDQPAQVAAVTSPRLIHKVSPRYPEDARRQGAEGTVIIEATLDETGAIAEAAVVRTTGRANEFPSMGESALTAVRQWRYEPARKDGEPVRILFKITIDFTLLGSSSNDFPLH